MTSCRSSHSQICSLLKEDFLNISIYLELICLKVIYVHFFSEFFLTEYLVTKHFCNKGAKIPCSFMSKAYSKHFSLFNFSFKLYGSVDILILRCGALNFNRILTLRNLVCFWIILFLLEEIVLFYIWSFFPVQKLKNACNYASAFS